MQAELETDEVLSAGDAADDPAIWISPNDENQSLIVATDERAGLCSFDLELGCSADYRWTTLQISALG